MIVTILPALSTKIFGLFFINKYTDKKARFLFIFFGLSFRIATIYHPHDDSFALSVIFLKIHSNISSMA